MCPAPTGVQFNFSFMLLQAASGRLQSLFDLSVLSKGVSAPDVHWKTKESKEVSQRPQG